MFKADRIHSVLGSNKFFYFVVGLFIFQAAWIALTARYPMAFDEQFHLGIIKLYSHQKGPFFAGQPLGADTYGAVARDPSYMYHYLMSFPYRLIASVTHSVTVQIITLRFFSIGFLTAAIFIFRKLLMYLQATPVVTNSALLVFVCLPAMPFLGAQINYDNLLIPLTALSILWTLRLHASIKKGQIDFLLMGRLAVLCMMTSLVKYAYLPVFVMIFCITMWSWYRTRKTQKSLRTVLRLLPKLQTVIVCVLLLLSLGLFVERYGGNMLRYDTPIPECDQVLTVVECQSYSPWARNYEFIQTQPHVALIRAVPYVATWVHQSVRELVFTLTSRYIPDNSNTVFYFAPPELPIPYVLGWIAFGIGGLSLVCFIRTFWRKPDIRIVILISTFYIFALLIQNFLDYKHLGQPVAIHGRYLLPIMPLLLFLWFESIKSALRYIQTKVTFSIRAFQPWLLTAFVCVFMIQGGGVIAYIVLSRSDWFWPQSQIAQHINYTVRRTLNPIVIGE
jgi:hypothetical protein